MRGTENREQGTGRVHLIQRVQIARTIEPSFRGTRHAQFERVDGFYLCDAWFEKGEPRMQIRSSAKSIEEAGQVGIAIQMATEWLVEEIQAGKNWPPDPCSLTPETCEPEASRA
jgi:hypothetical protein